MSATLRPGFELRGETTSLGGLLRDLWRSRGLLVMLAKKDFFVRYRRAGLGMLWAVGLPLSQAFVLAVIFSIIVRFRTGVDYRVFIFSGLIAWQYFDGVLNSSVTSIVSGSGMSSKIYFPRAIFPLEVTVAGLYSFLPALPILFLLIAVFEPGAFGLHMLLLPAAIAVMVLLAASFALVLSALQVYYRDVQWIVSALDKPMFWSAGVIFPLSRIEGLRRYVEVNPATGLIQLFRAATVGADPHWERALLWTAGWIVALLMAAAFLHRRYDRVFVDLL
jgi:lipopolysaccharide transport system permease protein